ncbi:MAG TPA: hypothetical protein PLU22_05415 [Polyangiaceae bacterium]|nr:hypothetical protein [Polyangiaceae bacterium]
MPAHPTLDAWLAAPPEGGACVVSDIDNTVADTRHRTLAVARAFDAERGSHHFDSLTLERVGLDGRSTAQRLGLSPAVAAAFQAFWASDRGFWCGARFASDRPIEPVAALLRRAQARGFGVVWLTGRIEALREPTARWLAAAGLPAGELVCKPNLGVRTAPFKIEILRALRARRRVAFFMTESAGDIAQVQAALPDLGCVLVDFPDREPIGVRPDTVLLGIDA